MNGAVVDAFQEVGSGWSTDRVVADPELNARFIDACRRRGLDDAAVDLNLRLLNTRKRGLLPRGARRTRVPNQDGYIFASEIAIRSLERKHQTTLDRVLCDPVLAQEFDAVASAIAPGFSAMEYRWAALRLRKSSRLKPEILGRAVPPKVFGPIAVPELDLSAVPGEQGVYVLTSRDKVLYVGEAQNLRARLKKHLDHSDNKLLARYIWQCGHNELMIEYHVLPKGTRTDVRKAIELELIRSRRAEFNVQR
jgi:site-specific DNA-methyltransferase (adenine-specific)